MSVAQIKTDSPNLRRSLNLPLVTLYGLGNILGAGIYVLVGKVAGEAGYFAPFSFITAALVAGITAFSFSELASRFPVSAGAAVYVKQGFGSRHLSLAVGLLIVLTGLVSAATLAKGFNGYLAVFVSLPEYLVLSLLLISLGSIAAWGVAQSVIVAAIFTSIEVIGLLLILYVASPALDQLPARQADFIPSFSTIELTGIFGGAFLAFYAFIGFEDMVNLAEETKNPQITIPRAIFSALIIATIIYVFISLSSILVLSPEELNTSVAPLADVYFAATNREPWFISFVSLFAVINGALIQIIMGSRVCYGLAKQELISPLFGRVHSKTQTPLVSTAIITFLAIVAALWLPLETLAQTTSYLLLLLFSLVNSSLIKIKLDGNNPTSPFSVPLYVPIAGLISCILLLIFQTWSVLSLVASQ